MADADQQQQKKEEPIIIKKKKVHKGHGHHGGAWKVAYADFVTAMMAFFIVMWILASSQEVKQAVAEYFNDPGAFDFFSGKPIAVDLNLKPAGPGGGDEGTKGGPGEFKIAFDAETVDSVVSKLKQQAMQDSVRAAQIVKQMGDKLLGEFKEILSEKPEFEELLNSIKIEMTEEGLRIELIESSESLFFEIGSANLKKKAQDMIARLGREIGKLPNYVEIEGHTDSRGYGENARYSNWELSADRANSARKVLGNNGLWEGQITKVTGFSDRKLRNPDNPFDLTNRRVSILIKHLGSDEFMPSEAGGEE